MSLKFIIIMSLKTYDDKENFEIVLWQQIIPHSQHQPGWIKTEMWITEFSIGFK